MMVAGQAAQATWGIAAAAAGGVIFRPWKLPEAVWAVLGAGALIGFGLLPWNEALGAIAKGTDVYLFLSGMMILAELARKEGLFDWLAALAARHARGSASRLFGLVYLVGTFVTVFLSNDATAVVLTPAVYAATRTAGAEPLPYLFVCAFVANAASFVLPISNPANLVIFGRAMPNLAEWLSRFALPSALSIIATFAVLRWVHRHALRAPVATGIEVPTLSGGGRTAGIGITLAGLVLMGASFLGLGLGLPTFVASLVATAAVLLTARRSPLSVVRHVSWGVLPLVAGLFVLVEGLNRTGVIGTISSALRTAAAASPHDTAWGAGTVVAVVCNLMNNLPAALIAGSAVGAAHAPPLVTGAVLIGIDLGPNLSITGSLATILWLVALRREGEAVGAMRFLRLGLLVMPPALLLALAAAVLSAAA